MLSPVHTAPGNTQFQHYTGKLGVCFSLCFHLRKEDKNSHELLVNCMKTFIATFSLYALMLLKYAIKVGSGLSHYTVCYSAFNTPSQHLLIFFALALLRAHQVRISKIVSVLSRHNYYTPNFIEQRTVEGIQLVHTYHTSVIQQRKIV